MTGLDCNILVHLAMAEHPANLATTEAVKSEVQRGRELVIPSLVVTEFLHVVTDQRRFAPPLSMGEAISWFKEFLNNPFVTVIEPSADVLSQTMEWMLKFNLGRKRILDTHLAATLSMSGVTRLLTSNPADFAVFETLEIVRPV
jgi:predicted nucleic acid-binding protein